MAYFGDTIKCDDPACGICVEAGHNRCQQCGVIDCDLMMIHTALWERIAEDPTLLLCPDCMDQRLVRVRGFGIAPRDLTDCPINYLLWPQLMAMQGLPTWAHCLSKHLLDLTVELRLCRSHDMAFNWAARKVGLRISFRSFAQCTASDGF